MSSEEAGCTTMILPSPIFRNENSKRLGNSLGGRWWQREPFQPQIEDCIKILGRKNLVFFKVSGEVRGEVETLRGLERERKSWGAGVRKGRRETEAREISHSYNLANLDPLISVTLETAYLAFLSTMCTCDDFCLSLCSLIVVVLFIVFRKVII